MRKKPSEFVQAVFFDIKSVKKTLKDKRIKLVQTLSTLSK
jgi:hypothetical protein